MALGDILTVAGILLLALAIFAVGIVSLQCFFNECHRRRAQQASSSSASQTQTQTQSALWLRGGAGGGGTTTTQTTTRAARGGDHHHPELLLLRSLPAAATTVYYRGGGGGGVARARPDKEDDDDAEECVVCLAVLEDRDEARFLPCCNHRFHTQCVDTWLASRPTCPLCRINVVADADSPGMAAPVGGGPSSCPA